MDEENSIFEQDADDDADAPVERAAFTPEVRQQAPVPVPPGRATPGARPITTPFHGGPTPGRVLQFRRGVGDVPATAVAPPSAEPSPVAPEAPEAPAPTQAPEPVYEEEERGVSWWPFFLGAAFLGLVFWLDRAKMRDIAGLADEYEDRDDDNVGKHVEDDDDLVEDEEGLLSRRDRGDNRPNRYIPSYDRAGGDD